MMHVSYHGHSIVKIETKGKTILIDPFITGNELTDLNAEDVKADVILLTHGHNDHVGDTVEIAKRSGALVVAVAELATYLSWQGLNVHPMSIGGAYTFDFGTVKCTNAIHSSNMPDDSYGANPIGFIVTTSEKTFYYSGDTATRNSTALAL